MSIVTFAPVKREGTHVIITAYGLSGCGKTYSLIKLGRGLVGPKGRLGFLDTETGRGKIYAKVAGGYDYAELTPPFTPERYKEAIEAAEQAGIQALIIDSGSHEWEGIGGILEAADNQTSQSGKELSGLVKWAKPKARHKKYVQALLNSRMHLLISLRAKEKMVQLTDKMTLPRGARVGDVISEGHVPIQDKRFIFETTVQLFLPLADRDHLGIPIVEKCPEDLIGALPAGKKIDEETGIRIAEWVAGGAPVDHEFLALKRDAEAAAEEGTQPLRAHWRSLDKAQRDRLAPLIDNLGSIAASADKEAEERRQQQSHRNFAAVDDDDRNPFGLPPSAPDRPAGSPPSADATLPVDADEAGVPRTPPGEPTPEHAAARDPQQPPSERKDDADRPVAARGSAETAPPRVFARIPPIKRNGNWLWPETRTALLRSIGEIVSADEIDRWQATQQPTIDLLPAVEADEIDRALREKAGLLAMGDGR